MLENVLECFGCWKMLLEKIPRGRYRVSKFDQSKKTTCIEILKIMPKCFRCFLLARLRNRYRFGPMGKTKILEHYAQIQIQIINYNDNFYTIIFYTKRWLFIFNFALKQKLFFNLIFQFRFFLPNQSLITSVDDNLAVLLKLELATFGLWALWTLPDFF